MNQLKKSIKIRKAYFLFALLLGVLFLGTPAYADEGVETSAPVTTENAPASVIQEPVVQTPVAASESQSTELSSVSQEQGPEESVEPVQENPVVVETSMGVSDSLENIVEEDESSEEALPVNREMAEETEKKPLVQESPLEEDEDVLIEESELVNEISMMQVTAEKPGNLFEWLKEEVASVEENGSKTIELYEGVYVFDTNLAINKGKNITIINSSDKTATFVRADNLKSTMITIAPGAKLTLGEILEDHEFQSQEKTVGTVTYTETRKTKEGQFINNNIVVDGEGWIGDPADRVINEARNRKMNSPVVLDIKGEAEINGLEIKNFVNVNKDGSASSSPIRVQGTNGISAKLVINDINLHDNYFYSPVRKTTGSWVGSYSGYSAISIPSNGEVVMNGGSIHDNKASNATIIVGDIFNTSSTSPNASFTLNDGEIAHNIIEHTGWQFGGGLTVMPGGQATINGGSIHHNQAYNGGGVFVSSQTVVTDGIKYTTTQKGGPAYFTMNGGVISDNYAKGNRGQSGSGGGIYIDSSDVTLNQGQLLNNKADNMGGGIYISQVPIEFDLKNAFVTENYAFKSSIIYQYQGGNGGGFWHCPTGTFRLNEKDGNIVWNNTAEGQGSDIYATGKTGEYYLDGVEISDKFITRIIPVDRYRKDITFISENDNKFLVTTDTIAFKLIYNDGSIAMAPQLPLLIQGNSAQKGGGVGSNAYVDFGEYEPGNHRIEVEKFWDGDILEKNRKDEIEVGLFIGDQAFAKIVLTKESNWKGSFGDLPYTPEELAAQGLTYSVKELTDDYYYTVEELLENFVTIQRKWLNNPDLAAWEKEPQGGFYQYVQVEYLDLEGNVVKIDDMVEIRGYEDQWKAILTELDIDSLEDLEISYHGYDIRYNPSWSESFKGYANYANNEMNPHIVYIQEKSDGTYKVILPYLWTQRYGDPGYRNQEQYEDNTVGYRIGLEEIHKFNLTNYEYDRIIVGKLWDSSVNEADIPESLALYLTKNGERVRDMDGNELSIVVTKDGNWQGSFDKVPPFKLDPNHDIKNYKLEEDIEGFIGELVYELFRLMDIKIVRQSAGDYKIYKDYTSGTARVEFIPIELHVGDRVYQSEIKNHYDNSILGEFYGIFKDVVVTEDIGTPTIKFYFDEEGNPFPRDLGKFKARVPDTFRDYHVYNEGTYVFKLVKEDGQYVLYMPQLEQSSPDEEPLQFFDVSYSELKEINKLVLTNKPVPYTPPSTPPKTPPESPPETPEEPPEEEVFTPEEPPESPPQTPEESVEEPKKPVEGKKVSVMKRTYNPEEAPQTFVAGTGVYGWRMAIALGGLVLLRKRK